MLLVILSQDFYFAPKIIVGALDQLELAAVFVELQILTEDLCPTFVVALYHLV